MDVRKPNWSPEAETVSDSVPLRVQAATPRHTATRPQVSFVQGSSAGLTRDIRNLLHQRLKALTVVLAGVHLFLAFMEQVRPALPMGWPHYGAFVVILSVLIVLSIRPSITLTKLRIMELLVFCSVTLDLNLILVAAVVHSTAANDIPTVISAKMVLVGAQSLFIVVYGVLIPHNWKQAAAIFTPAAILPFASLYYIASTDPLVMKALTSDRFGLVIPMPMIAAFCATYSVHVMYSMRREVFDAKRFGQYRLIRELGAGGMGVVYKAEHVLLKRPCAIKFIAPRSELDMVALARFEREVRATAHLSHWNTIEIYDYGHTEDGRFYYVMELLPGLSLSEILDKHGRMPAARVIHFLRQTCGALREAHAAGIIHRDIKPGNIFATNRGGVWDVLKLLDFGLVKQTTANNDLSPTLSQVGELRGSPYYMSPEQAGSDDIDARSDIYSLGVAAYQLLTNRVPFSGTQPMAILIAHARDTPKPPSQLVDSIPADIEAVILRCLAKKPADRYQSAAELDAALAACADAGQWTEEKSAAWWDQHEPGWSRDPLGSGI